jgi:hypothetical protein
MSTAVKYPSMIYKWYIVNGFPHIVCALNSDGIPSCVNPSCNIKTSWFLALCMRDNPVVLKLVVVVLKWLNDTFVERL